MVIYLYLIDLERSGIHKEVVFIVWYLKVSDYLKIRLKREVLVLVSEVGILLNLRRVLKHVWFYLFAYCKEHEVVISQETRELIVIGTVFSINRLVSAPLHCNGDSLAGVLEVIAFESDFIWLIDADKTTKPGVQ